MKEVIVRFQSVEEDEYRMKLNSDAIELRLAVEEPLANGFTSARV